MAAMLKACGKQSCRAWAAEPWLPKSSCCRVAKAWQPSNDNTDSGTDMSRSPRTALLLDYLI